MICVEETERGGRRGWLRKEGVVEEGRECGGEGGTQSCPAPHSRWKQGAGGRVRSSASGKRRVEARW